MLRGAIHHEDVQFANTPADVVKRFSLVPFDPDLTKAKLRRDAQPQRASRC